MFCLTTRLFHDFVSGRILFGMKYIIACLCSRLVFLLFSCVLLCFHLIRFKDPNVDVSVLQQLKHK